MQPGLQLRLAAGELWLPLQRRYQHAACRPGGTEGRARPTYEEPATTWLPSSTAPSGLIFYSGGKFTDLGWQGQRLHRRTRRLDSSGASHSSSNAFVAKEEVTVVKNLGQRIRVVKQGPDGWMDLATDSGQLSCIWR